MILKADCTDLCCCVASLFDTGYNVKGGLPTICNASQGCLTVFLLAIIDLIYSPANGLLWFHFVILCVLARLAGNCVVDFV